jgi:broad specificity phosphatase PhoE
MESPSYVSLSWLSLYMLLIRWDQWGPDPPLTAVGIDQARALKAAWEAEIEAGIPLPQALYASPFTRVAETLRLSIGEIMVEGMGLRPMVLEGLRFVLLLVVMGEMLMRLG